MGLDPIKIFSASNYSTLDLTHCFISRDHFLPMRMLKLHRRVNLRKNIFIVSGSGFEFSDFRVPIFGDPRFVGSPEFLWTRRSGRSRPDSGTTRSPSSTSSSRGKPDTSWSRSGFSTLVKTRLDICWQHHRGSSHRWLLKLTHFYLATFFSSTKKWASLADIIIVIWATDVSEYLTITLWVLLIM